MTTAITPPPRAGLPSRQMGKDGPHVHPIGFGAMSFAGFYGPTTDVESLATLAHAMALGVTHWDTSNVYGEGLSERVIGAYFKAHPGARDKVHLATKGGIKRAPGSHVRTFDNSADYLRSTLEGSLERLGVSKVDLYYIHRREAERPIEEVQATLARFVEEGLIGGVGYSEIAPASLRRAHKVHPVMAVQSEYSLWTRTPENGLLQACAELGVTFVAFSPLGRAMLADAAPEPAVLPRQDFRAGNPRFTDENYRRNQTLLTPFYAMARAKGLTPATLALAWVLDQGPHIVPIPGTRSVAHLTENALAREVVLTDDDRRLIGELLPLGFAHGDRYTDGQWLGVERYS